jgi:hypothetical protein
VPRGFGMPIGEPQRHRIPLDTPRPLLDALQN